MDVKAFSIVPKFYGALPADEIRSKIDRLADKSRVLTKIYRINFVEAATLYLYYDRGTWTPQKLYSAHFS